MRELVVIVWEREKRQWELKGLFLTVEKAYNKAEILSRKYTAVVCNADYLRDIVDIERGYSAYHKGLKFDGRLDMDRRVFNSFFEENTNEIR